jgi:cell division protein FtsA
MAGRRLEAEIHIVTGATTAIHNLVRCVNRAGLQIDSLILQPLASAEAVLTSAEKEIGCSGGYWRRHHRYRHILRWWGRPYRGAGCRGYHVTNDLVLGLRAPFDVAERIKIESGSAVSDDIDPRDAVEVNTFDEDQGELISRRLVAEIIESRMQEIFSLIELEIRRAGFDGRLPAGVVLVGGSSELHHMRMLGREVLNLPVRIGIPIGAIGLTDTIMRPAYATSIGLLLWAAYHTEGIGAPATSFSEWKGVGRLRSWFREF